MQECLACQNVSVLQLNFMRGYIVLKEALHLIHLLNKKPRNLQYNMECQILLHSQFMFLTTIE
jgi:hypothetical protein